MPAESEKQRRFFGAVLSARRTGKGSKRVKKVASNMSEGKIKEFLTKRKRVARSLTGR